MIRKLLFGLLFIISVFLTNAQTSIDKIIATVGKEIILQSDLEQAYAEYAAQFTVKDDDEEEKCIIFENLVYTKLMLHQADVDSIVVTEQQVEAALNWRMNYYLQRAGGDARVIEKYFGKSMAEIRKDLRDIVRDQIYIEQVQDNVTANISITPSEVKAYSNRIGVDSMPLIPATYEFGHILKTPPVSEKEIAEIKAKLENYREQALRDDNPRTKFSMFARMYSDDPGSASKGGDLGFVERGQLYPEFEVVAFSLKSGEISHVVKTRAGYHIIMLQERRGESLKLSHILIQPKPSAEQQVSTIEYLDSARQVILDKKMNFNDAALEFSEDPNKLSGGWVINPYTQSTKFDREALDPATFAALDKLIPGEYSSPVIYINEDGVLSYRLLYLKSKVAPHRANLVEDYDVIKNAAMEEKKSNAIEKWLINKVKVTSIKIDEKYKNCDFVIRWQIK
ncbi:MAG: peptidylprolyl isomerase [Bacteroidetes bacterium]|nr:peptidylprolyl isomerase [Bacteroidota bacterium]MCL1969056.1 peptidylprolyl isomerase [Bacteroidota bacterium]